MPSEAQIAANRRNEKLSTGPRTEAGRLRRAEAEMWKMSIRGDQEKNRKKGLPEDQNVYINAICDNKDFFDRIYRYQASTARILNRSLETLLRLPKLGPPPPRTRGNRRNEPNSRGPSGEAAADPEPNSACRSPLR